MAESGKEEVRSLYKGDNGAGKLKGASQEKMIEEVAFFVDNLIGKGQGFSDGRMYKAVISAPFGGGKNTAAQHVLNKFIRDGKLPADVKGHLTWLASEGEATSTYHQNRTLLARQGREGEIGLVRVTSEGLKGDVNKKWVILVDEDLKLLTDVHSRDSVRAILEGRIVSMPDWKPLPDLLVGTGEGRATTSVIKLVKEQDRFLTKILGDALSIEKGEFSLSRTVDRGTEGSGREEVKVLYVSDALLDKFLKHNGVESLPELTKQPGGEEKIAAFNAAAEARVRLHGVDHYVDDAGEPIPLTADGQANRVHDSNAYRAVASKIVAHADMVAKGLSVPSLEKMLADVKVQNRGKRITTPELVDRMERGGVKGLLLLSGALTDVQVRLLETEFDADFIGGKGNIEPPRIEAERIEARKGTFADTVSDIAGEARQRQTNSI
ncbi:MAG: hypothetical protein AAB356_07060, partial [Deltaproteobacteria bacterium]